jgi:hypothetical protein
MTKLFNIHGHCISVVLCLSPTGWFNFCLCCFPLSCPVCRESSGTLRSLLCCCACERCSYEARGGEAPGQSQWPQAAGLPVAVPVSGCVCHCDRTKPGTNATLASNGRSNHRADLRCCIQFGEQKICPRWTQLLRLSTVSRQPGGVANVSVAACVQTATGLQSAFLRSPLV